MGKAEWGTKRQCQSCGAKFYDMGHEEIICPACDTVFDVEASIRLKRNHQQIEESSGEQPIAESDVILDDDLDADIGDDEGVLEDTSDIDTDDDVPVVKINKENGSE